jgi:hypothetical protein
VLLSIAILTVLFVLVVIPFLPGLCEIVRPRDDGRLELDAAYTRDPQFFAHRFRARFGFFFADSDRTDWTARARPTNDVRVTSIVHVRGGVHDHRTVLASTSIEGGTAVQLGECYAGRSIVLGPNSRATALLTEGTLRLQPDCTIESWLNSGTEIWAESGCDLGRSASCGGALHIAQGVRFHRLWGNPIASYPITGTAFPALEPANLFGEVGDVVVAGDYEIPPRTIVHGSIWAGARILVGAGARVYGNVIASTELIVQTGAALYGHVVSRTLVTLGPGSCVGTAQNAKTVYGNRVVLAGGVQVHGSIVTERGGSVE